MAVPGGDSATEQFPLLRALYWPDATRPVSLASPPAVLPATSPSQATPPLSKQLSAPPIALAGRALGLTALAIPTNIANSREEPSGSELQVQNVI